MAERDMTPEELQQLEERVVRHDGSDDNVGKPASEADMVRDDDPEPTVPIPPNPD